MPKIHPLPQVAIAPPLPVIHNPPPVRDTRPATKAEPFLIPAAALVGQSLATVPAEVLGPVKAAFNAWIGDAKPTKRKAREFLSRFAGRTVSIR